MSTWICEECRNVEIPSGTHVCDSDDCQASSRYRARRPIPVRQTGRTKTRRIQTEHQLASTLTHDAVQRMAAAGTPDTRSPGEYRASVQWREDHYHDLCWATDCGSLSTDTDHIRPIEFGGDDRVSNLQRLCKKCHRCKSSVQTRIAGPKRHQRTLQPVRGSQ